MSETGLEKEADVVKAFPAGSDVEVEVLEVDPAGRRVRLSRKAVLDAQGRDELRDYAERSDAASSQAFGGSLADKLRGALEPRKQ
jgi:ribosomal protein S1